MDKQYRERIVAQLLNARNQVELAGSEGITDEYRHEKIQRARAHINQALLFVQKLRDKEE